MKRKGFVLPGVLMLICILILFAAVRHFFSRNQLVQAAHDANYEKAFHLAIGGIESSDHLFLKAAAFFNDSRPATFPKAEKAPPEIEEIIKQLLDREQLPFPRKDFIQIKPSVFKHLQSSWEDISSLKVEIELRDLGELVLAPDGPGPIPDPREKGILVMLHAEANVKGTVARVCRYREARLVNILPSALGKFSLFLRKQGNLSNNSFEDSLTSVSRLKDTPLIVFNGKTGSLNSLAPNAAAEFFETQGWVFLGGDSPWIVGCGAGGGNPDLASALLDNEMHLFEIKEPDEFASLNFLNYYSQSEALSPELKTTEFAEAYQSHSDELFSSKIRVSGSKSRPTPTNVVGKVIYKWALIQGLFNQPSKKFYPYPFINESQFNSHSWPGMSENAAMTMVENFGGIFNRYKARMSTIIEERYNALNLRALKFSTAPLEKAIMINPENIPSDAVLPEKSKRLVVDDQAASFIDANYGNSYQICRDNGTIIFAGNLSGFENLQFMKAKVCETFTKTGDFFKRLENSGKELILDNAFLIKGDLNIDRRISSIDGCGGMIIAEGDVAINNEILAPNQEVIVIVSLGGNIRVNTSGPVHAGLIALKGKIIVERGLDVQGVVAAEELSMSRSAPTAMRKISYNPNFDSTDSQAYLRAFKLFMPKDAITFVK
ncbi:MAG: hypothetical protein ACOYXC_20610 [Candidatus Rifleibacteriota bacterium]